MITVRMDVIPTNSGEEIGRRRRNKIASDDRHLVLARESSNPDVILRNRPGRCGAIHRERSSISITSHSLEMIRSTGPISP